MNTDTALPIASRPPDYFAKLHAQDEAEQAAFVYRFDAWFLATLKIARDDQEANHEND